MAERLLGRSTDGHHAARSAGSSPGTAADPKYEPLERVREICEEIAGRVDALAPELEDEGENH